MWCCCEGGKKLNEAVGHGDGNGDGAKGIESSRGLTQDEVSCRAGSGETAKAGEQRVGRRAGYQSGVGFSGAQPGHNVWQRMSRHAVLAGKRGRSRGGFRENRGNEGSTVNFRATNDSSTLKPRSTGHLAPTRLDSLPIAPETVSEPMAEARSAFDFRLNASARFSILHYSWGCGLAESGIVGLGRRKEAGQRPRKEKSRGRGAGNEPCRFRRVSTTMYGHCPTVSLADLDVDGGTEPTSQRPRRRRHGGPTRESPSSTWGRLDSLAPDRPGNPLLRMVWRR